MVAPDSTVRTDGHHIGRSIKEIIRLTLEEGLSWQNACDRLGHKRARVARALSKPHVRQYAREKRRELIEDLSARVPLRLSQLMYGDNEASSVRACLALESLRNDAVAAATTQIRTGGIIIQLVAEEPRALPHAAPQIELKPIEDEERIGARGD
jgi:hypothetical protein